MSSPPSQRPKLNTADTSPNLRIAGGFHFVPFVEDNVLSTRGKRLPSILQTRSHSQLVETAGGSRRGSRVSTPNKSPLARRDDSSGDETDLEAGKRSRYWRRRSRDDNGLFRAISRGRDEQTPVDAPAETPPLPPMDFPLTRGHELLWEPRRHDSIAASVLLTPQMRSQRLIGNSNPRYRWGQYYKTEEELNKMRKPLRQYYERNNYLIQQYLYIDRLLDSSLPHHLIQEYNSSGEADLPTIREEALLAAAANGNGDHPAVQKSPDANGNTSVKVKRTPRDIYRVPDEDTPLLQTDDSPHAEEGNVAIPAFEPEYEADSDDRVVTIAIYLNLAANTALLIMKIIVTVLTSSLSVLASLVDAALDFLSTAIVWVTTHLISQGNTDLQNYPVGRRRLEPIGVLVFSVIMITSFFQVFLEAMQRLSSQDHTVVQLSPSAIAIMAATVVIKFICWLYCRLIRNSSVQALAQDAMTDIVFNTFSIIFPLVGYFFNLWFLDPLGGLLLSLYVIVAWSRTTSTHIQNLTGRAASKDERNILLYLTMRFAHTIRSIQSLSAYHAGDKLNVEVDIVLDEEMSLRDSHDLGESLQYVLESVPGVERAFVHADYRSVNLPSHMKQ